VSKEKGHRLRRSSVLSWLRRSVQRARALWPLTRKTYSAPSATTHDPIVCFVHVFSCCLLVMIFDYHTQNRETKRKENERLTSRGGRRRGHTNTHMHTHTRTHTRIRTRTHAHAHAHVHAHAHTHTHTQTHTDVDTDADTDTDTGIGTDKDTNI